jgi:hypothetical protein
MRCIGCGSEAVAERPERTAQGYRRFRCRARGKQLNERSGTVLNRTQYPSDVVALVVLWRLRYELSLRDLPEMFALRGMVFSHEAVREWEAKLTPALAEDLRRRRRGKAGRSWYVDETLYLTAVSGRSRGMRPGQPERDVRPRVCDVDGALGLATAPSPRSDGIEGHSSGMSLHRQGGSAHGGASRGRGRHGVARHRRVEGQAGLRAPGR